MSNAQEKSQSQNGGVEVEVSARAEQKVALDIEDADFLKDEEEAPPPPPPSLSEEKAPVEEKKKSKLVPMIGAVVLLVAIAAAVWWFFLRTPPPPEVEPEIIVVPDAPAPAGPSEFIVSFEPYWVPLPDNKQDGKDGEVFLICKFAIVTENEQLMLEAQNKMVLLRDAVYYYLVNKPYHFLIDPANVPTIKKDLASVFSGYLASGKIDDMLFESYLGTE